MHSFLQILILFVLIVLGFFGYRAYEEWRSEPAVVPDSALLTFNEKTPLRVRVADTELERLEGLSNTNNLDPNEGVLFVFDVSDFHGIWMKDMRYPLDILWVDEAGVIVSIEKAVTPDSYPKTFRPQTLARFVIEVNAHFTDSFGIRVGDRVAIPKNVMPDDLLE